MSIGDLPTELNNINDYNRLIECVTRAMSAFNLDSPLEQIGNWNQEILRFFPAEWQPALDIMRGNALEEGMHPRVAANTLLERGEIHPDITDLSQEPALFTTTLDPSEATEAEQDAVAAVENNEAPVVIDTTTGESQQAPITITGGEDGTPARNIDPDADLYDDYPDPEPGFETAEPESESA